MKKSPAFSGFDKDSFHLFRDLADPMNNNRVWFDANRSRYEVSVVGKMRELLEALKPFVLRLNPQFECGGKTLKNFSRINRDIRFSNDKSPYKLNYYLYFYDQRRAQGGDGRLYVGLNGEGLTVGFSIYGEWRRKSGDVVKDVLRKRVLREGSVLEDYLRKKVAPRHYQCYWYGLEGKEWTRFPGLPGKPDHWSSLLGWVVRRRLGVRQASRRAVLDDIQAVFRELYPLYVFSSSTDGQWRKKFQKCSK